MKQNSGWRRAQLSYTKLTVSPSIPPKTVETHSKQCGCQSTPALGMLR